MLRKCLQCGKNFEGRPDATLCATCAEKSKAANIVKTRTCCQCGKEFSGGPRARYCPDCRQERRKEADRKHRKNGTARPIGSTDICVICGKPYIVYSGNQKYCPDCAPEQYRKIDQLQSIEYNQKHYRSADKTEKRHMAAAEIPCAVCGKLFIPHYKSACCSPECRELLHKQQCNNFEANHRVERNAYHNEMRKNKEASMLPEEYKAYREKINEKARINYQRRKNKS